MASHDIYINSIYPGFFDCGPEEVKDLILELVSKGHLLSEILDEALDYNHTAFISFFLDTFPDAGVFESWRSEKLLEFLKTRGKRTLVEHTHFYIGNEHNEITGLDLNSIGLGHLADNFSMDRHLALLEYVMIQSVSITTTKGGMIDLFKTVISLVRRTSKYTVRNISWSPHPESFDKEMETLINLTLPNLESFTFQATNIPKEDVSRACELVNVKRFTLEIEDFVEYEDVVLLLVGGDLCEEVCIRVLSDTSCGEYWTSYLKDDSLILDTFRECEILKKLSINNLAYTVVDGSVKIGMY